jgi:hypothetical protein
MNSTSASAHSGTSDQGTPAEVTSSRRGFVAVPANLSLCSDFFAMSDPLISEGQRRHGCGSRTFAEDRPHPTNMGTTLPEIGRLVLCELPSS